MGAEIGGKDRGRGKGAAEGAVYRHPDSVRLSYQHQYDILPAGPYWDPAFSDRLIAINMIGTKTVLMIALLIKVFHEGLSGGYLSYYMPLISFPVLCGSDRALGRHMGCEKGNRRAVGQEKENTKKEAVL